MKNKFIGVTAAFAVTNFLLLSHFSQYRFDELLSFNWDIALMLTPFGIAKNLIFTSGHYLVPYYHQPVQLPPGHSFFPTLLFIAIQIALSFYLLKNFRGSRK